MDAGAAGRPQRPNPRVSANPLSVLCFWWTVPLFSKGRRKDLGTEDLYDALARDRSGPLGDRLDRLWREEQHTAKEAGRPPSLTRALARCFWWHYSVFGLLLLFHALVLRVSYPLLLGRLVAYFNPDSEMGRDAALGYAAGVSLVTLSCIFFWHHITFGTQVIGMRVRVACSALVYRKALRLSSAAQGQTATGQVVNLLSNDVSRFDQLPMWLHFVWVMPLQTVLITYFIWEAVGLAAFVGVGSLFLQTVPVQSYLGKLTGRLRLRVASRTDERVRLMDEIVSGIQVIKMYAWEQPFERLVEAVRAREILALRGASYLRGVFLAFIVFSERTSLFFTLLAYVLLGHRISADKVFMLAQFYNVLQASMAIFYPQAVQMAAEASVSISRLERFLLLGERALPNPQSAPATPPASVKAQRIEEAEEKPSGAAGPGTEGTGLSVAGLHARWISDAITDTLANISFTVPPGKLCAVVGPVGAGKSSLLQVLLGELPRTAGDLQLGGRLSYAAQQPWLFAGSVRNNILFGRPFDARRYRDVVRACALTRDLQLLPLADKTAVGDRGVALSGGQRVRVNLARAVYHDADVYLLDDPLSAVDAHVGKHLFDECVCGLLADRTRVLVTHQLQYLKQADLIVVINNGQVEAKGTYNELAARKINFTALLASSQELEDQQSPFKRHMSTLSRTSGGAGDSEEPEEEDIEADETTEMIAKGALDSSLYAQYFKAGSSLFLLTIVALLLLLGQVAASGCDYWVTFWTNQEALRWKEEETLIRTNAITNSSGTNIMNTANILNSNITTLLPEGFLDDLTTLSDTTTTSIPIEERALNKTNRTYIPPLPPPEYNPDYYYTTYDSLVIYSICLAGCVLFTTLRAIAFFSVSMNSSKGLHDTMFAGTIRATMRFFNTNPSGRILNRFSKDMGSVDELLPKAMLEAIQVFLVMSGILTMVIIVNSYFIPVILLIGLIFYMIRKVYLATAQDIRRLEGITKSPVFSHLAATLNGITTIRAARAQDMLAKEFDVIQDENTACWYLSLATSAAFGFCLDIFSCAFLASVTFSFLIADDGTMGGYVGLAISQSLILTGMLQHGMRLTADVANNMTSVERLLQYTHIEQEAEFESEAGKKPPPSWPQNGKIVFDHLSLRYSQGDPPVLNDLNFTIQAGHKVGIVGRTGAGKSSLISALFRLARLEGAVHIDNINTQLIGLHDLRNNIAIIPQEPVLFSASLRYNLSPFAEFSDDMLWSALEEVELKDSVDSLDMQVSEGGANFSVGQRQLLCLARANLRNNRILVLDEATANVDPQTDALIQHTIRQKFKEYTVLTIAHRLNTIMDSDMVLVMDAGEAVEYDHPHILLQNKEGQFYKLVQETGQNMAEQLAHAAKEAYNNTRQEHS